MRLERAERTLGFGFVLRGDGRILGSLSTLGNGNFVRARFSDGHVLPVRVVATQRAWDLALLAPEGGHWTLGLRASTLDGAAEGLHLRRFSGRGRALQESAANITGKQTLLGRDGALLRDALLLGAHFGDDELGSPLCDERGEVVAIVGQACDPHVRQECRPAAFGIPVSALKQFLASAPSREPLPAAWLGLRGVASHSGSIAGVRVIAIEPGSPAERAGLQVAVPRERRTNADADELSGDVIVAVNDLPVTTPEELRDLVNRIVLTGAERAAERGADSTSAATSGAGGEQHVRLLVYGSGRFRQTDLTLLAPQQLPAAADASGKPTGPAAPAGASAIPAEPPPAAQH